MTALRRIAGPQPFLLVGDSKLISYTNAAAMGPPKVGFSRRSPQPGPGRVIRRAAAGAGRQVDYIAGHDGSPLPPGAFTGS